MSIAYSFCNRYSVVNYFIGADLKLRQEFKTLKNREAIVSQLQQRILVISMINIILIPFLLVYISLYALFRYGEEFHKEPGNFVSRQWSLAARWFFRCENEMPHVLDERLRLSTQFAEKYVGQFSTGAIQGGAKAAAFILGSLVTWMLMLYLLNEQTLLMLSVLPNKTLIWFITIFSAAWVSCRSVVTEKHVFFPKEAIDLVAKIVYKLPGHFFEAAGTEQVLMQFKHLFPLRLSLLLMEFFSVTVTPFIMIKRVRPKAKAIVDLFLEDKSFDEHNVYDDVDLLASAKVLEIFRKVDAEGLLK